jgi:dihydrofolate reductase
MTTNQAKQRKLIVFIMVTLDGFFEGPNQDISWHNVDQEFNEFAIEQLQTIGGILFGRVTYQGMASYWPTDAALSDDPVVAGQMNSLPKIVFSNTLDRADWNNTTLIKGDIAQEVAKLKQQPGKDLFIFGSGNLAANLTRLGLIDEYRLIINPVALGQGTPMFQGIAEKLQLKLLKTRVFDSGNVLLYYEPVRAG